VAAAWVLAGAAVTAFSVGPAAVGHQRVAIDSIFGYLATPREQLPASNFDEIKGKAERAVGDQSDDDGLRQECKGDETTGKVKDASTRSRRRSKAVSTPQRTS
jgi:uncharacterized protein YjbJ (UPF0337 family)